MTPITNGARDASPSAAKPPLLEVDNLSVEFMSRGNRIRAVNGVSYSVNAGETLGIIGESGSGKSVTAQAIMGILDHPGKVTGGSIRINGVDVLTLSDEEHRKLRGESVAMVFQDALSALNPTFTVGFQVSELFRKRRGMSRSDARKKTIEVLDLARVPDAKNRMGNYPHEFSGGMRQRVMIAMALALDPQILIADEPTTALDVTIQSQVMQLLSDLQSQRSMAMILITHDMGVVADVCDRIAVMYAGRVVENAPVQEIYSRQAHPYTRALLRSIPRLDEKLDELETIEGRPPSLDALPGGCSFHPRCSFAKELCRTSVPEFTTVNADHGSACHFWEEVYEQ